MLQQVKIYHQLIQGQVQSTFALLLGWGLEMLFIAQMDSLFNKFTADTRIRALVYLLILFCWFAFWLRYRLVLPRNHRKKIGIVVAIFSENEIERQRLKADFIAELKKHLLKEGILKFAEVHFLKNHFAKRIVESNSPMDEIKKMNKKMRAHFFVWGNIKKRPNEQAGEKYFLSFQGFVTHKPIPQELQVELSRDFSAVLPSQISFLERDFRGFEVSAAIVHLAAKYIIGVAAYVSQDPQLAFRLHNGLREQFNMYRPLPAHLQSIRDKIPVLLSEEALWIARWHQENGRTADCKNYLQRSLRENPQNYASWLRQAVIDFQDEDISKAFKSIKKAEQFAGNSGEWRYSKAFLHFWSEEYQKALKQCQKIKGQSFSGESATCEEVRKFNQQILEINTQKSQLYFWIGFISYFKQKNLANALEDFEKFEELSGDAIPTLKQKSSAHLTEIRRQMEIANTSTVPE